MPSRLGTGIAAAATLILLLLPFDAKVFELAQTSGKAVLIHVYASWGPVWVPEVDDTV